MTTVRSLVAVATIVPIVSVSALLAVASPAQAVARLDIPSRVTSNRTVTLSGTVDPLFDAVLFVNGRQVAKGDRKVSYSWDPRDRPNGSYEIKVEQRGKLLGAEWHQASKTLTQAAPPSTPSGVAVRLRGGRAMVTWRKGSEPDLRGYQVSTSQTGKVGLVRVGSACSGGSCKATLSVPAKAAGRRIGFTVRALRGNGSGGTLTSGDSAIASVSIPVSRAPQTTQDTGSQNAGTGKTARKTTGSRNSTTQQNTGRSTDSPQSGKTDGKQRSGVQELPQLPAKKPATAPTRPPGTAAVPTKAPGSRDAVKDDGNTAQPPTKRNRKSDAAGDRSNGEKEPAPDSAITGTDVAPATKTSVTARSSETPTEGIGQYGIVIAGALILLLLGAHGGAWVRRKLLAADADTGAAAATPASGGDGPPTAAAKAAGDTGPAAATAAPRRPAVILAVVKTRQVRRVPANPSSAQPPSARQGPAPAPARQAPARGISAHAEDVLSEQVPARRFSVQAEDAPSEQVPARRFSVQAEDAPSEQAPAHRFSAHGQHALAEQVAGWADPGSESVEEPPAEPVHLTLPVAAPIPEVAAVTPVAVRIGDQWDGYLPPAPRSMEDSGFWERPQPGATDFWAADDREEDDPSYSAGRRVPGDG
ncbi:hypothetical protein [Streptosporangium minutum]|uniref:hypothetical protein n=1 Tax=Streptosporangium minutum TaxID=569862 RepID=UPI001055D207|nr:hypothetical protein [Streptosporangium minutum]